MLACLSLLLLCACSDSVRRWPIDPPFYLGYIEDPGQIQMFRCEAGGGCAADELPDAVVFAAGANASHIVAARHPSDNDRLVEYYYIERTPPDERGYGNRRTLFGPFTAQQFEAEKRKLGLPEFTVKPGGG